MTPPQYVDHSLSRRQLKVHPFYISDELSLWFVTSTKAHANILSIDPSAALAVPGVVDYVDYRDVPGSNMYGPMVHDIPLFAEKEVRNTFISLLMLNILYSKHNQTCFSTY